MSETDSQARVLRSMARIVAAHAKRNTLTPEGLIELIRSVHASLAALAGPGFVSPTAHHQGGETSGKITAQIGHLYADVSSSGQGGDEFRSGAPEKLIPAVPIKRSIHRDYLISLEDGAKMKMLKRHLATTHGLTPDQYRAKWGLPADYPMVAPAYAERRSVLAKEIGLGRTSKSVRFAAFSVADVPAVDVLAVEVPAIEVSAPAVASASAQPHDVGAQVAVEDRAPSIPALKVGSVMGGLVNASSAKPDLAGVASSKTFPTARKSEPPPVRLAQELPAFSAPASTSSPFAPPTFTGDDERSGATSYTAESVFANFRNREPEEETLENDALDPAAAAKALEGSKRKRFAQQPARRMPRKHGPAKR